MRYLSRTHRVSVGWLHERCSVETDVEVMYTSSELMVGDIYTKAFTDAKRWDHARSLISIIDPKWIERSFGTHPLYKSLVPSFPRGSQAREIVDEGEVE